MGEPRIRGDDGVAQGLHNFGFDIVRQMPPHLRGRQFAPAILDLFLLGERVVYARKKRQPWPE